MNWADRLDAAVQRVGNPCLVGIDPHLDLLPDEFALARDARAPRAGRAAALERFCCELLDVVSDRVAAVKPQSAFFEVLGADGLVAWERVVAHAHRRGLYVIGDVKRGDIASTARAYAEALLGASSVGEGTSCDAITVSPWLGGDTLRPFVEVARAASKGIYVLVRTSNPGAAEFQNSGQPPMCEEVARVVTDLGAEDVGACGYSCVGAVVAATRKDELRRLRALLPHAPLLLPGYGAQGASAEDVLAAFPDGGHPLRGAVINSARGIAFAYRKAGAPSDWRRAASDALDAMIEAVTGALNRTSIGSR